VQLFDFSFICSVDCGRCRCTSLLLGGGLGLAGLALGLLLLVLSVEVLGLGDGDGDLVGGGATGSDDAAGGLDLLDDDHSLVLQHLSDGDGVGDGGAEGGELDDGLTVVQQVLGDISVDELAFGGADTDVVLELVVILGLLGLGFTGPRVTYR